MADKLLQTQLQELVTQKTGRQVISLQLIPVGGGSINNTYRLLINGDQSFFCKINNSKSLPGIFQKEINGLRLIAQQQVIRTPEIIFHEAANGQQVLLLEWIEEGLRTEDFWKRFGKQLACLHQVTHASFGLAEDNYMGALPQYNHPEISWIDFFVHRRLEPQISLAADKHLLSAEQVRSIENIYRILPGVFDNETPSLLHGDLWSGNFLCDTSGQPVLIDPAAYYGHRSVDLAMTTLFGGFDAVFYSAYQYQKPFPENYLEQWALCNLYPLLVHLNLFGRGYLADILHTIRRYS